MKAFVAAVLAVVVIAVVAGVVLDQVEMTTARVYATDNVRL